MSRCLVVTEELEYKKRAHGDHITLSLLFTPLARMRVRVDLEAWTDESRSSTEVLWQETAEMMICWLAIQPVKYGT